ncbi:RNA polymerase sigma factor [Sphingomonas crocodyli]|uniref:Sigma-70 family RNA polymerase sigma factor n=1 Tax=Sphingomonas crocodyli TaxID=1979270 RepID=A0A437M781_9SPHN|nr:sigma-70 family RNA polymerase sigma factor [Sphingomonas crocodyli]RVT93453.1 sigma-70 family RNA polymerase sigma factor [Sphingomonas crocodyli]
MHAKLDQDDVDFNRRWRPALMSFFLRRVRDHTEAEDLTQEVFTRLLGSQGEATSSLDAYVFQVAGNLLTDRARRARVRADYRDSLASAEELDVESLDPHRIVASRAELEAFGHILNELPERTRTIFILYRLENLGQSEIADAFGITSSAVKKHVAKAMGLLMKRMRAPL